MPEQKKIPIDELHVDPANVRPKPDVDTRQGLYPSVENEGVLEPLTVRPHGDGYGVILGSRRLTAARTAGLEKVPCVIRRDLEGDDEKAEDLSFKENEHREDLPGWVKKKFVKDRYGDTDARKGKGKRVKEVADRLDLSRETVYKYLDIDEKLDPTLNILLKEPSERSNEEKKQLEEILSEKLLAPTNREDIDLEKEKAKGFPNLKKIPVEVAKMLAKSDIFQELQEDDLEKAHKAALEAAKRGRYGVGEVLEDERKKLEGEEGKTTEKISKKRGHEVKFRFRDEYYTMLEDWKDHEGYVNVSQTAKAIVGNHLDEECRGKPRITSVR